MAGHVCPWWVGYLLINPLRRLYQAQDKILGPYVKPGMTVLEVGPGMGYFSLWMARAVGEKGRVVCVDVQQKMISSLKRRTEKAGLGAIIDARVCGDEDLRIADLSGQVDFCLAFAVAHEIENLASILQQIRGALKSGGICLLAEPKGHVTESRFSATVELAAKVGFAPTEHPHISRSWAVLLESVAVL